MSHCQAGGPDVISHRKVLPPGEWTRSVLWHYGTVFNQFLIYSTFVLIIAITAVIYVKGQNSLHQFPHNFPVASLITSW